MIRASSSAPRFAAVLALLALIMGLRLRAAEEHTQPLAPPATPAQTASKPPTPRTTEPSPPSQAHGNVPSAKHSPPPLVEQSRPAAGTKSAAKPPEPAPSHQGPASAPVGATSTTPNLEHNADLSENGGIQSLLNLGKSLSNRADYASAEIAFYQVLNHDRAPVVDVKSALLGLGRMFRLQGSLTKAAAIYERFLKDYPGDERTPDALLDLGRTLRALGVYKGAITRFYSVINSTLKLPSEGFEHYQVLTKTAQFEIAETHFQSGDYAEAAKFYARLRLLDLAPEDRARAHFKAAFSLRLKGDLETTITTVRAYIDQWPNDENIPEARYLLAITLRELNRPQEAFAATLDLLRTEQSRVASDPKRWAYWQRRTGNQLANDFFETGDTLNAHAIYTGLVDLAPEPTWRLPLIYQIALCYERLGILDRARTAYQSIIDTAGATPPADLAELTRMAAWRLNHLTWREDISRQVTSFFETNTGKLVEAPPPAESAASADVHKPKATSADIHKPTLAPATPVASSAKTASTP